MIHQHSVAVTSFVISGRLCDVTFDWVDSPEGSRRLLAQNRTGVGPRLLRTERAGDVSRRWERTVQAGQHYEIPPDVFHETRIEAEARVITVAMFVGQSGRAPLVVSPSLDAVELEYQPTKISTAEEEALRSEACAELLLMRQNFS